MGMTRRSTTILRHGWQNVAVALTREGQIPSSFRTSTPLIMRAASTSTLVHGSRLARLLRGLHAATARLHHPWASADASIGWISPGRQRRAITGTSFGAVSGGKWACDQYLLLRTQSSAGSLRSGRKVVRLNGLTEFTPHRCGLAWTSTARFFGRFTGSSSGPELGGQSPHTEHGTHIRCGPWACWHISHTHICMGLYLRGEGHGAPNLCGSVN